MIFIKGHVASSKNSKVWTGKRLVSSKQTATYIKESESEYKKYLPDFLEMSKGIEKPLLIGFHFVRKSRHKYDFHNAVQTVSDLMTKYGYIPDDNTTEMMPCPLLILGSYEAYDKDDPGVYIEILNKTDMFMIIEGMDKRLSDFIDVKIEEAIMDGKEINEDLIEEFTEEYHRNESAGESDFEYED